MSEEQGKQLATINTGSRGLQLETMDEMWRFATAVTKSGFAPAGMEKPEAAFIAIQMGQEVGLAPMQAIQNIAVINGRPSMWGDAAKGLVEASGLCVDFREWFEGKPNTDDYTAVCEVRRHGREAAVRQTFSVADAKQAKLWGKNGPWTFYQRRMLQMRARGFAIRDAFPDVIKGLVLAEEAQDYIDIEAREPAPTSLDEVADRFAPEPDPEPEEKPKKGKGKAKPEPEPEPDEDETPWENAPPAEPDVAEDAEKEELREEIQRIVELHGFKNKFQNMTGFEYSKLGEYEVNTLRQLLERMREATA